MQIKPSLFKIAGCYHTSPHFSQRSSKNRFPPWKSLLLICPVCLCNALKIHSAHIGAHLEMASKPWKMWRLRLWRRSVGIIFLWAQEQPRQSILLLETLLSAFWWFINCWMLLEFFGKVNYFFASLRWVKLPRNNRQFRESAREHCSLKLMPQQWITQWITQCFMCSVLRL